MVRAVLDEGRVSRFQCGLLHRSFSLIVLYKYYKRKRIRAILDEERVSQFQCGFLHQDCFLIVCTDVQEKEGVVRI